MPVPYGTTNFAITVPADALAPRSSAGAVINNKGTHIFCEVSLVVGDFKSHVCWPDDVIQNDRWDLAKYRVT